MVRRQHPEFEAEKSHLRSTLAAIRAKMRDLEESEYPGGDEHAHNALIEEGIARHVQLNNMLQGPYDGRFDFQASNEQVPKSYYMGKVGFERDGLQVHDWRAAIGQLFYHSRPGKTEYVTDEHETIEGMLFLKRLFEINCGSLVDVRDEYDARGKSPDDYIDPDAYLVEVMQKRQDIRLREIVATIRGEQDELIREDAKQVLFIQGVAGSGKTSIALHRLAYLLYPGHKTGIRAERCIVFGPSHLFLRYVEQVLPSLGVQNIVQTTLADWERKQIGLAKWKLTDVTLDALLSASESLEDKTAYRDRSRLKTSLQMGQLLERYVNHRRVVVIPDEGFVVRDIGREKLAFRLTSSQLSDLYTAHPRLSLNERRKMFIKECADVLFQSYVRTTDKKFTGLAGQQRKQRLRAALSHQVEEAVSKFWPPFKLPEDYYALFRNREHLEELAQGLFDSAQLDLLATTLPAGHRKLDSSDLPALAALGILTNGIQTPLLDHIVVDEAQDVSPLEYQILRQHSRAGSMTILGDMAQAIHPDRGITIWDDVTNAFAGVASSFHSITKSYRNTYEIMMLARTVLESVIRLGQPADLPDPLPRHGEPPHLHALQNAANLPALVRDAVEQISIQGYQNIAIICKTKSDCSQLAQSLTLAGLSKFGLVESADFNYVGGVVIVPVHFAKGMEFEASLVVGVDNKTYTDTPFDGRMLYVALTRALHVVHLFWVGQVSVHLEKALQIQEGAQSPDVHLGA